MSVDGTGLTRFELGTSSPLGLDTVMQLDVTSLQDGSFAVQRGAPKCGLRSQVHTRAVRAAGQPTCSMISISSSRR